MIEKSPDMQIRGESFSQFHGKIMPTVSAFHDRTP